LEKVEKLGTWNKFEESHSNRQVGNVQKDLGHKQHNQVHEELEIS
jgi:hypothetical protein